jgi:hypothetical protein
LLGSTAQERRPAAGRPALQVRDRPAGPDRRDRLGMMTLGGWSMTGTVRDEKPAAGGESA